MLRPGLCWDWRTSWYAVSNWLWMWSGVESGSLCMTLTDQDSWKGIESGWQLAGLGSIPCGEPVPIHMVGKGVMGFSNVENITFIAL